MTCALTASRVSRLSNEDLEATQKAIQVELEKRVAAKDKSEQMHKLQKGAPIQQCSSARSERRHDMYSFFPHDYSTRIQTETELKHCMHEEATTELQAEQTFMNIGPMEAGNNPTFLKSTAVKLTNLGLYEEGMECFEKAEQTHSAAGASTSLDYAGVLMSMGASLTKRGMHAEGMVHLQKAEHVFLAAGVKQSANYAGMLVARVRNAKSMTKYPYQSYAANPPSTCRNMHYADEEVESVNAVDRAEARRLKGLGIPRTFAEKFVP